MTGKDITNMRGTIEFLKKEGELLSAGKEVDPVCEVTGVAKAFEDGPAVLFENIKGYPENRILANVFGKRSRIAKIFGVDDPKEFKFKVLDAIKNPIEPEEVSDAPCQEVVITEDIDVLKTLPVTQSIENDPGRIIGGGNILLSGPGMGRCVSHKRTFFRGKDWASLAVNPTGHFEHFMFEKRKENGKLPITINIGTPPAVMAMAAAGLSQLAIPAGTDEIAIAGGLQGEPVKVCRAKTVDAEAIAEAEWVIEGYIDTTQVVWESDEAEKTGDMWQPFFIEWHGYQGWARRTYKFQATAITHRKENPIFYASLASVLESHTRSGAFVEATVYDLCNKMCPGLVVDTNVLDCMHGIAGVVIQVKKRRRRDEGVQKNLILANLVGSTALQMVIVVDEDVNIYSAEDVLWAIATRIDPKKDVLRFGAEDIKGPAPVAEPEVAFGGFGGKIGIDATVPVDKKRPFSRGKHPAVDLKKWFDEEEINKATAMQNEYARFLAENRY